MGSTRGDFQRFQKAVDQTQTGVSLQPVNQMSGFRQANAYAIRHQSFGLGRVVIGQHATCRQIGLHQQDWASDFLRNRPPIETLQPSAGNDWREDIPMNLLQAFCREP